MTASDAKIRASLNWTKKSTNRSGQQLSPVLPPPPPFALLPTTAAAPLALYHDTAPLPPPPGPPPCFSRSARSCASSADCCTR